MPKSDSQKSADDAIVNLFFELLPFIPIAVRKACHKFGYHPDQASVESLIQQIIVLLIEKDYDRLRSFAHRANAKTWLSAVVRNYVLKHIQQLGKEVSLEEFPEDSFTTEPKQERIMLSHERKSIMNESFGKLTEREQKLYRLLCEDGLTAEDIAKAMRIKPATVHRYKHTLIKKIQKHIGTAYDKRTR